jgi:tetratricopeptide (TPR) repeat protein
MLARLAYQAGEKSDDYSLALKSIQAALQQLPDEPRWQSLAGEIFLDERGLSGHPDPGAALPYLQAANRLEPGNPRHASLLGKVCGLLGDLPAAVTAYQEACRLNPNDWGAWLDLSRAQQAAGSLETAIYSADRAIERDGSGSTALELRGRLALAANDPPTAVKCAQAILNQEPADVPAWLLISQAFSQLDRPQDALQALEHAIPISEHPKELLMARAVLLRQTGGIPAAQQAWRELAERYPGDADILAGLAEQEVEAGNIAGAVQAGKAALQADLGHLDPTQLVQLNLLVGQQLRLSGEPEAAISYTQNALRKDPTKIDAYLELGRSYQDLRRPQQALVAFREAIAIAPKDPRPYFHAGIALKEAKDYQEAETLLRRAAQLAPRDVNIHRQLGAVVALNLIHNRSTLNVAD